MRKFILGAIIALAVAGKAVADGAVYVIIVPDSWVEQVRPLAEWKTRKGLPTRIVPLSECGSSASRIKNYLAVVYSSWIPRPRYVLLVGDPDIIPFGHVDGVSTDSYYANVTGDFKNELIVGRFSVTTAQQAAYMVYKTVMYESDPFMDDTLWFMKGMTIVREDGDQDDSLYYWYDARMAHRLWRDRGFVHIDSLSRFRGNNANDILDGLNDGRSIVIFRGQSVGTWWSPFNVNVDNMETSYKWPFVIGATCRTISGGGDHNMDKEFTLAGNIDNPKGAIGYFGTTTVTSNGAWRRSYVTRGFLLAMYGMDQPKTLGEAAEAGRMYLYQQTGTLQDYYGFQLIGDPELNLWTHTPMMPMLIYPSVVRFNMDDTVTVSVYYPDETPVKSALVSIHTKNDSDVYEFGYTDDNGRITFVIYPHTIDTLELAVSGKNLMPTFKNILVITEGPYLTLQEDSVSESYGNLDGYLNPGERAVLSVKFRNVGMDTAREVNFRLTTEDTGYVTLIDSLEYMPQIEPNEIVEIDSAFVFEVSSSLHKAIDLHFMLTATGSSGDTWRMELPPIHVYTPMADVETIVINDSAQGNGDGKLSPMEHFNLLLNIRNASPTGVDSLTGGVLYDGGEIIPVTDTTWFGRFEGETSVWGTPIEMVVSNTARAGDSATIRVRLVGYGLTYSYVDTVDLTLVIGTSHDPYGPDQYGYWAYDNTDSTSMLAPQFQWFEIAPPAGGPGEIVSDITNEDADTVTVALPFRFKFYGLTYDSIGLCSNGFMEFQRSSYRFGDNAQIPNMGPPRRMLAPFWDDLDPSLAGDIYQYYDEENHRWIVEFYQVAHYGMRNITETFQVQLLDPAYYPTPTGDGIILFLYDHVSDASSATIGIEDHTNTRGIQYVFNNDYHISSAPIEDGRVIMFSTQLPAYYPMPNINLLEVTVSDTVNGNGNGLLEPGETFAIRVLLSNVGGTTVHDIIGTLTSDDSDVSILTGTVNFGDVDSLGGITSNEMPFIARLRDTVSDTTITMSLHISSSDPTYENDFAIELSNLLQGISENGAETVKFMAPRIRNGVTQKLLLISFSIPKSSNVSVELFDASGRRVMATKQELYSRGSHTISVPVAGFRSGVYFAVVQIGDMRFSRKFVVLK